MTTTSIHPTADFEKSARSLQAVPLRCRNPLRPDLGEETVFGIIKATVAPATSGS